MPSDTREGGNTYLQAKPWGKWFVRLGYVSRGVIYIIIGVLALQAASGLGGGTTGKGYSSP